MRTRKTVFGKNNRGLKLNSASRHGFVTIATTIIKFLSPQRYAVRSQTVISKTRLSSFLQLLLHTHFAFQDEAQKFKGTSAC
jgi:hypothetical protein